MGEIDDLIKTINKDKVCGENSIMLLGDTSKLDVEVIPTGSYGVDRALGVGGYPRGRIIEILGPESSGKTTLALQGIANAQAKGLVAAFIDAEHALDVGYAKALGTDTDNLIISQPDTGEQALEIVKKLVESGKVGIIVVDSVAALTPKAELEGNIGESHMGLQARMMSQAMRMLNGAVKNHNVLLIFINQIRMKIGVMWGSPETTSGGNALKFYATCRLDVRRIGVVREADDDASASKTKVKIIKNKVAAPFRECEFNIVYGKGIDSESELIDMAIENKIVKQSGSWYSYGETKLGQGRGAIADYMRDNPDFRKEIIAKCTA